ncbi:electron transfer flavoprotein subunit alpha, mitochondrial [Physcomitrium patens]|uniref:electron transfer flavoprotein subunit alpha, mitochondrial n=1 Tax=Physcomitrium patens TaxID=3218 RepID=UPI000D167F40|nr:electron transfer flavoprotein subunit alpha, mitochondrial-like [Physcomitrium patens]|eukprot:XP_024396042.1 electron transfer flavoprotein subunit alpha, mitochondrial-like [Physcomitrella patens]
MHRPRVSENTQRHDDWERAAQYQSFSVVLDLLFSKLLLKHQRPTHPSPRSIYAGNALPAVRYVGSGPCIFSIRPTSFAVSSALPREAEAPISALDTSGLNAEIIERSEWLGQQVQESERPELGSARVVVSGGRGLKSKESFEMLEKLADELGGAGESYPSDLTLSIITCQQLEHPIIC